MCAHVQARAKGVHSRIIAVFELPDHQVFTNGKADLVV